MKSDYGREGVVVFRGYGGTHELRCMIIGETRTKWRVQYLEAGRVAGANRSVVVGDMALVPKSAVVLDNLFEIKQALLASELGDESGHRSAGDSKKRVFKVGTFYHPRAGRPPTRSKIMAYTAWYNPAWDGCVEFTIEADSGTAAKREAVARRLAIEFGLGDRQATEPTRAGATDADLGTNLEQSPTHPEKAQ